MIDVAAPATRLLDYTVARFGEKGWPLPERRYVAAGAQVQAAIDDQHLMVSLVNILPGSSDLTQRAGAQPSIGAGSMAIPRATLMLRLMRCIPTAKASSSGRVTVPSAQELNDAGIELLADPGRLLDCVVSWAEAERPVKTVTWGQVEPQGPEGGMAGHLVSVTLSPIQ